MDSESDVYEACDCVSRLFDFRGWLSIKYGESTMNVQQAEP